jgi:hypothetical protein
MGSSGALEPAKQSSGTGSSIGGNAWLRAAEHPDGSAGSGYWMHQTLGSPLSTLQFS